MWVAVAAVVIVIIVVVSGLYFAGYLGTMSSPGSPVSMTETPKGTCTGATNCGFSPANKAITTGTKVTWTNDGTQPHTATACSSANSPTATECPLMNDSTLDSFDSGASGLSGGQTFSFTFNKAGVYHYYCRIHSFMHGNVTVT